MTAFGLWVMGELTLGEPGGALDAGLRLRRVLANFASEFAALQLQADHG